MLSTISWGQSFTAIGIGLVNYYAWVFRRFYRDDWQSLFRRVLPDPAKPSEQPQQLQTNAPRANGAEPPLNRPAARAATDKNQKSFDIQSQNLSNRRFAKPIVPFSILLGGTLLATFAAEAQDGNAGINQANTMIRSYFATAVNLIYENIFIFFRHASFSNCRSNGFRSDDCACT